MENLNINTAGVKKAMDDRNSVLEAMGFGTDNMEIEINEPKNSNKTVSKTTKRYGNIIERKIQKEVFEVEYENHSLYLKDLKSKRSGYFVGE